MRVMLLYNIRKYHTEIPYYRLIKTQINFTLRLSRSFTDNDVISVFILENNNFFFSSFCFVLIFLSPFYCLFLYVCVLYLLMLFSFVFTAVVLIICVCVCVCVCTYECMLLLNDL